MTVILILMMQCSEAEYSGVQCRAVQCSTVQFNLVYCSAVQKKKMFKTNYKKVYFYTNFSTSFDEQWTRILTSSAMWKTNTIESCLLFLTNHGKSVMPKWLNIAIKTFDIISFILGDLYSKTISNFRIYGKLEW